MRDAMINVFFVPSACVMTSRLSTVSCRPMSVHDRPGTCLYLLLDLMQTERRSKLILGLLTVQGEYAHLIHPPTPTWRLSGFWMNLAGLTPCNLSTPIEQGLAPDGRLLVLSGSCRVAPLAEHS